jgi:hypothetical protein
MSTRIKDTLVIKRLERTLGRPLTEEEMRTIETEGVIKIQTRLSLPFHVHVTTYEMPWDLMPDYAACWINRNGIGDLDKGGNRWVSSPENRANKVIKADFWESQMSGGENE